jgi:hypothetical protein
MKRLAIALASLTSIAAAPVNPTVADLLGLCRMVTPELGYHDVACVERNFRKTESEIDALVSEARSANPKDDRAAKLMEIAAIGRKYSAKYCSVVAACDHGDACAGMYDACVVERNVVVISELACVASTPSPLIDDERSDRDQKLCDARPGKAL